MSSEWPSVELGELLEHQIGGLWGEPAGTSEEDALVVRITELRSNGGVDFSTAVQRSFTKKQVESRRLRAGDILLEKSGGGPNSPVGRVALIEETRDTMVCTNFMLLMRPDSVIVDSKYLHQFLTHFHSSGQTAEFQSNSTNIRNISVKDYLKISVPLPPLDEQKRIVAKLDQALGYVDELIDLQKQVVSAQGTFWSKALSAKFADQQKQKIGSSKAPCTLVKLGAVAKLIRGPFGGSITKAMFVEEGFAVYEQQHAIGNQFAEFRYFVNATKFEELKRFEVRPGHLIMSCAGTIGRVAEVPESAPRGIINQALMKIVPSEELDSTYLRLYLSGSVFQDQLDAGAKGSALKNAASVSDLRELLIPLPPLDEQQRIVRELLNLKSSKDQAESSALSKLGEITRLRSSILAAAFAGDL